MEKSSPSPQASEYQKYLEDAGIEFETSFSIVAVITNELSCSNESITAAKRAFAYNPNSKLVKQLFPNFTPILEEIGHMVDTHGQVLREKPDSSESWIILGHCYLTLGDFANALASYSHAIRINPTYSEFTYLYALGVVYLHFSYTDLGIDFLQRLLKSNPKFELSSDASFRLAIALRDQKRYEESIQTFQSIAPTSILTQDDLSLQVAYTQVVSGKSSQAQISMSTIYSEHSDCRSFVCFYCFYLFSIKSKDLLSRVLASALSKWGDDDRLRIIAGRMAFMSGDMQKTINFYGGCIGYWGMDCNFWAELSYIYYRLGRAKDAISGLRSSLSIEPNNPQTWLNIGFLYSSMGENDKAIGVYRNGLANCVEQKQLKERMETGKGAYIDADMRKMLECLPDDFSRAYIGSVPVLPEYCYGPAERVSSFKALSTVPRSAFAKE